MAPQPLTLTRAQAQVLLLVSLDPCTVATVEAAYFTRYGSERKCKPILDQLTDAGLLGMHQGAGRIGWSYWLTSAADCALDRAYALLHTDHQRGAAGV